MSNLDLNKGFSEWQVNIKMIYSVALSIIVLIVVCVWIHSLILIKSRELNLYFSVLSLLISHVVHVSLFAPHSAELNEKQYLHR